MVFIQNKFDFNRIFINVMKKHLFNPVFINDDFGWYRFMEGGFLKIQNEKIFTFLNFIIWLVIHIQNNSCMIRRRPMTNIQYFRGAITIGGTKDYNKNCQEISNFLENIFSFTHH